jgi:hypothetical protein
VAGVNASLLEAIDHLAKSEWDAAHAIVQADESELGCWLHGIVHVVEGDIENARYWYARAHRTLSTDVAEEIAAARSAMQ